MIHNIKNKSYLITLDLRLNQIRVINNNMLISFIDLSNNDVLGYDYLFNNSIKDFFRVLKDELRNNENISLKLNDFEVLK